MAKLLTKSSTISATAHAQQPPLFVALQFTIPSIISGQTHLSNMESESIQDESSVSQPRTRKSDEISASPSRGSAGMSHPSPREKDSSMELDPDETHASRTSTSGGRKESGTRTLKDMWDFSVTAVGRATKPTPSTLEQSPNPTPNTPTGKKTGLANLQVRLSSLRFPTPSEAQVSVSLPSDQTTPSSTTASLLRSTKQSSAKRVSMSGLSQQRIIPTTWKYKYIMEISVKVPQGPTPFTIFRDRLFAALDFLHKYGEDPNIVFLPKQESARSKIKPPLLSLTDFPLVQCNMRLHYFFFSNVYSFTPVNQTRGRRIVFSLWMGFDVDPTHYLAEMSGDLEELHCTFNIKELQAMNLVNAVVFWGAPQYMCKVEAKHIVDKHLKEVEQTMISLDPQNFPKEVHGQPWPQYSLVLEQPVSFERTKPGEWVPPSLLRAAVHLKCAQSDSARFVNLVAAAKSNRVWLTEFGKCFPSAVATKANYEADRDLYDSIVNGHMAVMHSYGKQYVPGLLDALSMHLVTKLPDAHGVVHTHRMCIRDILQDVEFGDKKVFACVL